MALITVASVTPVTISQSETDNVLFTSAGTLNIAGQPQAPIAVTLSQVAGAGLLSNINISNARVLLGGAAGVSAIVSYNIGSGGTLEIQNAIGIAAGSSVRFTGGVGRLVIDSGINISLLGGIYGFGPGKSIDVAGRAASRLAYSDNTGTGTGGTLTLLDASNNVLSTVALSTGDFVTSNFRLQPDGAGGTLIDLGSVVAGVTATPATAALHAGQTVVLRLGMTDPITIAGGTPTLALNDGGIANFDAGASTGTSLAFTYTVGAGQNTSDLAVSGVALNGATLAAVSGGAVDLSGAMANPAGTLTIDTTLPTVGAIATSPGSGTLGVGGIVLFSVTTSEAVTVANGIPTLTLSDGGNAAFDAASSTATTLVFRHTVQAGQNAADLAVSGTNLNGATIADIAGNSLDFGAAIGNPAGTLVVDTTAPASTGAVAFASAGPLRAGQTVLLNVALSEPVTVTGGTPTLALNDGGTATFDANQSSPTTLVFSYTVQPGENTPDLAVIGASLAGAAIADGAGNPLDLAGVIGNPAGILAVDTLAPVVTAVATAPGSGGLAAGQTAAFDVALSEAVTLTDGTPTLFLNDGGTATYDATASTASLLVFTHTVQPGQNAADLAVIGASLNGASAADAAGNGLDLGGAIVNPAGTLRVDTTAPFVTGVFTTPVAGPLAAGRIVTFAVAVSETVIVAGGTPTLSLSDGGAATFDAAQSTATALVFVHTVQPGQNSADLAVTAANLNGATIADSVGNLLDLTGAVGNPAGLLPIDTTAPTATGLVANPSSGSLGAGQTATITVALSEAVTVAGGVPTLALSDGGTAIFDAASSAATSLVFRHTVLPGQNASDLAVTGLALEGAIIADAAGNGLSLATVMGDPAGVLAIDTLAPLVVAVSTAPGAGSVAAGQTVGFAVTVSEAVSVFGGLPTLALSDGGTATFDAGRSSPTTLVFDHLVQPGQTSADLAVTGVSANGATVADAAGNALDLADAIGNPAGTLQVDTTSPAIIGIATSPGSGAFAAGAQILIDIDTSEPVSIAGGTPTLTLSDGGTAGFEAARSTATTLVFTHIVQPGQNTADLAITGTSLGGAVIADSAGNPLDLSAAIGNPAGILMIDTSAPVVAAVTTTPASGAVTVGQTVTIAVAMSEPVSVAGGAPTLALNDGGAAAFDAATSSPTLLVFSHTVQPGQNAADLAVTAVMLNGATITDTAGNPAELSGIVGNPPGTLQTGTAPPLVTSVSLTPGTGVIGVARMVTVVIAVDAAVTVTGGTPTLVLSDGGTALYDAAMSTATSLVFAHTVQPGQNAADLAIIGTNLNGATIVDAADNALPLAAIIGNPAGILQVDTTAPAVAAVSTTPSAGDLAAGRTVDFQVALSEAVLLIGGAPALLLNDGGTASYDPGRSTLSALVFTHVVQAGQNAGDLAVLGVDLNGASIADAAGNAADLSGVIGNPPGTLQIDTTPPTVVAVTTTPPSGTVVPGQALTITLTTSKAVDVAGGAPALLLNSGGAATYDPADSTQTQLVFRTVVQAGQATGDLAITGLSLNGASVSDAAGHAVSLGTVQLNPAQGLSIGSADGPATGPATEPVYRFFDTRFGTHFYTSNPAERATILQTRPDLIPEGTGGVGLRAVDPASNDPAAVEVYRFFDTVHGTQFLTASVTERDSIIAGRPDLVFEPAGSFYEHAQPQPGDTPVYRFFDTTYGTHFYTDSAAERASIVQTRPDLVAEGIGFYEPAARIES